MTTRFYHPKGSMCAVCKCRDIDCSKMDFKNMPRMRQYSKENDPNVFVVVKCLNFNKDT
jgi:hypothetical protein